MSQTDINPLREAELRGIETGAAAERERVVGLLLRESLVEGACLTSPASCSCHLLMPTMQFVQLLRGSSA